MSKLGRYSAQRRKVVDLGTTATTIATTSCGTEFLVSQNGTANIEHTLPTVAAAGAGWWCAFTLSTAVANGDADVTITAEGAIIQGVEAGDSSNAFASRTSIVIEGNSAQVGTRVELWTDGAAWYAISLATIDASITTA